MKLCLITDKADFAAEAESVGVDRIMVDLERKGKRQRQTGLDLFISNHVIESVPRLKAALSSASLVVRINPLNSNSSEEIETLIDAGADFLMLPFFHTVDEVRAFVSLVKGRAKTILLVETGTAVKVLPAFVSEKLGDEVHIGLNDLRISLNHRTIFEPICNGMIDEISRLLRRENVPFGFGGIARLSRKDLPVAPERILGEQVRLGAGIGWLGRTFRGQMETERQPEQLAYEINLIRNAITKWQKASAGDFEENRKLLLQEVATWEASLN